MIKTQLALQKIKDTFPHVVRIESGNALLESTLTFGVSLRGSEEWALVVLLDSDFGPMYVEALFPPLNSQSVARCVAACGENFHDDRFKYEWEMEHMRSEMAGFGADSANFFYGQAYPLDVQIDPNMAIPPEEIEGLCFELGRPATEAEIVAFSQAFTKALTTLCNRENN